MTVSTTTNLGLSKPSRGTTPWDTYVNDNADTIDALFGTAGHSHSGAAGEGPKLTADGVLVAAPSGIGTDNVEGSSTALARADHVHLGTISVGVVGIEDYLGRGYRGNVKLDADGGITLGSSDNTITIHGPGDTVSSLGNLGDGVTLTGAVKLAPGTNVTITRSDGDNSLIISATVSGISGGSGDFLVNQVFS